MADSKLYDVLGVSRGATESEIRRVSKEMLSLGVRVYLDSRSDEEKRVEGRGNRERWKDPRALRAST